MSVRSNSDADTDTVAAQKQYSIVTMMHPSEPDATGYSYTEQDAIAPDNWESNERSAAQVPKPNNLLVMSKTRKPTA